MVPLTFAVAPIESKRYQLIIFPATWEPSSVVNQPDTATNSFGYIFRLSRPLLTNIATSLAVLVFQLRTNVTLFLAQGLSCGGPTPARVSHMPVNIEDGCRYCKDARTV